jgi:FkbM family methyltransferase
LKTITLPAGDTTARIEVDETDHIGRIINRGTWYEKDLLDSARQRVTGPGLAVDVGAHVGNHSLWFALAMGLHVVALEPNTDTFMQLARNLDLNELRSAGTRPWVRAIPVAAGARPGWGHVVPSPVEHNSGMASIERDPVTEQVADGQVPIVTLDELGLDDVRLIKIDVEGAASSVLVGAAELIASQSPVIYAEGDRNAIKACLPKGYKCFGQFAKTPTFGFAR